MKTGFLHGYAWRNLFKSYYYHGILMQCKTPPAPGYWIGYNTTPPINPPNWFYECDGLPATATPPMAADGTYGVYTLTASGGLLHFIRISGGGAQYCRYKWTYAAATHIIIEENHPRLDSDPGATTGSGYIQFIIGTVNISCQKSWQLIGGVWTNTIHKTLVFIGSTTYYTGEYQDYTITELIKNPITLKWDLYFMGAFLVGGLTMTPINSKFLMSASTTKVYIDLDYFRMWLNTPRE